MITFRDILTAMGGGAFTGGFIGFMYGWVIGHRSGREVVDRAWKRAGHGDCVRRTP